MRRKKLIRLIIIVVLILATIIGITKFINKNKTTHKLSEIYNKLNDGQAYLFEMERNDDNKMEFFQKMYIWHILYIKCLLITPKSYTEIFFYSWYAPSP